MCLLLLLFFFIAVVVFVYRRKLRSDGSGYGWLHSETNQRATASDQHTDLSLSLKKKKDNYFIIPLRR